MKFRGLLAAVVVLLALGGVLYWSNHRKPANPANSARPPILKVQAAAVTGLTLKPNGGQTIVLAKSGPHTWQIQAPGQYPANATAVTGMISTLGEMRSERVIEEKPTDLSRYGLSQPSFQLDFTENHQTREVSFGDNSPTGGGVYVTVAGDPRVYMTPSWVRGDLNKSLDALRDKRVMPVPAATVVRFDLIRNGQTIEFARVGNGWQIQKPQTYRTDTFQVDDLLDQVTGAQWDPGIDPAQAEQAFAHAKPYASVKLMGSTGEQTLEVRQDHDDYYAKSSAAPGTWKVQVALGEALGRTVDSFRNKQLFDFAYAEPNKLEVHSGTTALFLNRAGSDWWSVGTKMDSDSIEDLASALRSLAATKFVDSGFTAPDIRVTVTSGGGKQVETVEIQKTKDGGIARRADGPTLYAIDADTMSMLEGAISGVKPAKAATPVKK
ncbi:MAG TPA: DUF4340 domain-containing protein [Acidobacteriaceae bacterium]|nr:DUF4340 domain-containing protein [Acidobacteriaceae bacterium]